MVTGTMRDVKERQITQYGGCHAYMQETATPLVGCRVRCENSSNGNGVKFDWLQAELQKTIHPDAVAYWWVKGG